MEYPLYKGLSQVGLPLVVGTCTDDTDIIRNICFLIDTGSTDNILFSFVHEHFQKSFKPLEKQNVLMGLDGKLHNTPQVEVTFNFENMNYTSRFSVVEVSDVTRNIQNESGIQVHGVLGVQFLIENKWIIDFEKYNLYAK